MRPAEYILNDELWKKSLLPHAICSYIYNTDLTHFITWKDDPSFTPVLCELLTMTQSSSQSNQVMVIGVIMIDFDFPFSGCSDILYLEITCEEQLRQFPKNWQALASGLCDLTSNDIVHDGVTCVGLAGRCHEQKFCLPRFAQFSQKFVT